jgi:hypothetical protein
LHERIAIIRPAEGRRLKMADQGEIRELTVEDRRALLRYAGQLDGAGDRYEHEFMARMARRERWRWLSEWWITWGGGILGGLIGGLIVAFAMLIYGVIRLLVF